MGLARHLNANQRALEGDESTAIIDIIPAFRNPLFRAFFGAIGAVDVDFMSAFRSFRENPHLVVLDFNESPCYGKEEPSIALAISKFSDFEFGKQWRMPGEDAEVSLGARNLQLVHVFVNDNFEHSLIADATRSAFFLELIHYRWVEQYGCGRLSPSRAHYYGGFAPGDIPPKIALLELVDLPIPTSVLGCSFHIISVLPFALAGMRSGGACLLFG